MQTPTLSVINLITHASLPVQFIMLVLLIMMFWALFVTGKKVLQFHNLEKKVHRFSYEFWDDNILLEQLYERYLERGAVSIERIFRDGFSEFRQFKGSIEYPKSILQNCRQAMEAAMTREINLQEKGLSLLAAFGSSAPYIGLLGTVYGIMNSFIAIGAAEHASTSISSVAPGIAEALIATAMGLLAAIPSVLAYNHFVARSETLQVEYEAFIEDFCNLLERQLISAQIQHRQQQHSQMHRS